MIPGFGCSDPLDPGWPTCLARGHAPGMDDVDRTMDQRCNVNSTFMVFMYLLYVFNLYFCMYMILHVFIFIFFL